MCLNKQYVISCFILSCLFVWNNKVALFLLVSTYHLNHDKFEFSSFLHLLFFHSILYIIVK